MEAKDIIEQTRSQAFKEYQTTHFVSKEPYFTSEGCHKHIEKALFKAGIKEVVDWGEEPCPHWISKNHTRRMKRLCPDCWQAFLKEKGIK